MISKIFSVAVAFMIGIVFGNAASVTFQTESGAPGSDWTVSNSTAPVYIFISTQDTGNNPISSNRVATYTVTFPAADTYQLYARIQTGPGGFNSDSVIYGNGFGAKKPTNNADWVLANGLAGAGFSNSMDVVTGGGTLGSGMWKWINLSQFASQSGFTVSAGNLTQTFQLGGRETNLCVDKFVFGSAGYTTTMSNLDSGTDGAPPPPVCAIAWTNLLDWQLLFSTNPATMPVAFADANTNSDARFYCLQLGP